MSCLPAFKVGIWQDETPDGGIAACLKLIEQAVRQAAQAGVDMLVFPECFLTGYYRDADQVPDVATAVTPDHIAYVQRLSRETGIGVTLGAYQQTESGVANTAYVFLPERAAPLIYHKRALFGDWEKSVFIPGTKPLTFLFRGRKCAVLICFDIEFPELVRELTTSGVDTILVPTALMSPEDDTADFLVPARAIENSVTIVYANRVGTEHSLSFIGKSQICGPSSAIRICADGDFRGLVEGAAHVSPGGVNYIQELHAQGLAKA